MDWEDARQAVQRQSVGSSSVRRYRMVALDLDGTLLETQSREMSHATVAMLQSLVQKGLQIAICTGRSLQSTIPHIQRLNKLSQKSIPVVSANGSEGCLVHSDGSVKSLFVDTLSPHAIQRIHDMTIKYGYTTLLWCQESSIYAHAATTQSRSLLHRFENLIKSHIIICDEPIHPNSKTNHLLPTRMVILTSPESFTTAWKHSARELQGLVSIIPTPAIHCIEFLGARVNKGSGLTRLCDTLGIPIRDCIAIGDGDNDVEFLQIAGLGMCMKNGTAKARMAADAITEWTNNENGVDKALEHLKNLQVLALKKEELEEDEEV